MPEACLRKWNWCSVSRYFHPVTFDTHVYHYVFPTPLIWPTVYHSLNNQPGGRKQSDRFSHFFSYNLHKHSIVPQVNTSYGELLLWRTRSELQQSSCGFSKEFNGYITVTITPDWTDIRGKKPWHKPVSSPKTECRNGFVKRWIFMTPVIFHHFSSIWLFFFKALQHFNDWFCSRKRKNCSVTSKTFCCLK